MSFMSKIKDFVTVGPDEGEEFENEFEMEEETTEESALSRFAARKTEKVTQYPSERRSKASADSRITNASQIQVALVRPERFEDAKEVADHLNDKRTVVLNLEAANNETKRRMLDFLSGVAYANNGRIKQVAKSTFIITPHNVDVMGELIIDDIENSNTYY